MKSFIFAFCFTVAYLPLASAAERHTVKYQFETGVLFWSEQALRPMISESAELCPGGWDVLKTYARKLKPAKGYYLYWDIECYEGEPVFKEKVPNNRDDN